MKGTRNVFQTVFDNQQLLFVLIMLVLEKKLLLHQLLHFVNGRGFKTESLYGAQTMGPTGVPFMMIGKSLFLGKEDKKHSISSLQSSVILRFFWTGGSSESSYVMGICKIIICGSA